MQIHYGPDDTNVDPPYFSPYDLFYINFVHIYSHEPMSFNFSMEQP